MILNINGIRPTIFYSFYNLLTFTLRLSHLYQSHSLLFSRQGDTHTLSLQQSIRTVSCTFNMKTVNASAIFLLFTLGSCLVSALVASLEARQVPIAKYTLTGYSNVPGTPYPYYNISVPEDGVTIPISASSPALISFPSTSLKVPL